MVDPACCGSAQKVSQKSPSSSLKQGDKAGTLRGKMDRKASTLRPSTESQTSEELSLDLSLAELDEAAAESSSQSRSSRSSQSSQSKEESDAEHNESASSSDKEGSDEEEERDMTEKKTSDSKMDDLRYIKLMKQLHALEGWKIIHKDIFKYGVEVIIKRPAEEQTFLSVSELQECYDKSVELCKLQ